MNKEEIKQEIYFNKLELKSLENAAQERRGKIAELEKQLAKCEPELVPCRWCGSTAIYVCQNDPYESRHRCTNGACLTSGPKGWNDEKESAAKWNEMNDTRPARVIYRDGKRLVEFRVLVNAHDDAVYDLSWYGDITIDGRRPYGCVVNYEDLKIEVK